MALSTRFGVNVYSYESDLCVGGEWFLGRRRSKRDGEVVTPVEDDMPSKEAALNEASLRADEAQNRIAGLQRDVPIALGRNIDSHRMIAGQSVEDDRDSVIKARLSGNWVSARQSNSVAYQACEELMMNFSLSDCSTKLGYAIAWSPSGSTRISQVGNVLSKVWVWKSSIFLEGDWRMQYTLHEEFGSEAIMDVCKDSHLKTSHATNTSGMNDDCICTRHRLKQPDSCSVTSIVIVQNDMTHISLQ